MQSAVQVMWNTPALMANGGEVAGRKRRADESNVSSDAERFAKRFNLLNLGELPGHSEQLYGIARWMVVVLTGDLCRCDWDSQWRSLQQQLLHPHLAVAESSRVKGKQCEIDNDNDKQ